jgi:putative FmdB family regulatory protein
MPSYEYVCPECGASIERHFYPIEFRNQLPTCVLCGIKMDLVIGAPALRFNGEGWQTPKPVKEGES